MPSYAEIKKQIRKHVDGYTFMFIKKEVKELENILNDNEQILYAIQGMYLESNGAWILTDNRIILLNKKMLYGTLDNIYPYEQVTHVENEVGIALNEIEINFGKYNEQEIKQVYKKSANKFVSILQKKLDDLNKEKSTQSSKEKEKAQNSNNTDDIMNQLQKLHDLKQSGAINDKEFEEMKERILTM